MRCRWRPRLCWTWCNLGSFGGSFAPSQAQRRHNMGNIAQHEASPRPKKRGKHQWQRTFWGFRIGPAMSQFWSHVGLNLGRNCSQMGPTCWGQAAPSWSQVGPKLEPGGSKLDRSCGLVGRSWLQVEPMLRPCWIETAHLDAAESCTSLTDLFGCLPLLHYYASAPSVRAGFFVLVCPPDLLNLVGLCAFSYCVWVDCSNPHFCLPVPLSLF